MKYAFMSFSCPDLDFSQLLETAKRYGYDGVEPRIDAGHKHGVEPGAPNARELRKQAADAGISVCCIATSCVFADPERQAENVGKAKSAIDLAAELGAPAIRVFGGKIPSSRERSLGAITEALAELSEHARANGVTVCLETHDDWCDPKNVAAIMENVNHPFISVNWDIMHPVLTAGWAVADAFHALKPWIRHVHVHDGIRQDGKLTFKPIGEGGVDHAAAVKVLRDFGYEGFLSGEWIAWEPADTHLPRELARLKSYESQR